MLVSGLIMKFKFYKMWLNCYDDFDVTRLERILAHSSMNTDTVNIKRWGFFGVLKLQHDTHTKKNQNHNMYIYFNEYKHQLLL